MAARRKLRLSWLVLLAACCATPAFGQTLQTEPAAAAHVDFRTVILTPSGREGRIHVTEFVGFRCSGSAAFFLLQPVEGIPDSVSAQAMTMDAFDRAFTNGLQLEGAFYERARAERSASRRLFSTIGANGGLPAWLLLATRWQSNLPALTAVAALPQSAPPALHTLREARVLRAAELKGRGAPDPGERVRAALNCLQEGCLIAVSGIAAGPQDFEQGATSGVRISYDAPLRREDGADSFRLLCAGDGPAGPAALTRIYVVIPPNRSGECVFPVAPSGAIPPQQLVNDALSVLGRSAQFRKAQVRERAAVQVSFVRAPGACATTRLAAALTDVAGEIKVTESRSFAGPARIVRQEAGAILLRILWPLAALLYLIAIWLGIQTHLWLTGAPHPPKIGRKYLLVAVLGPLLTPWFMLRYVARAAAVTAKTDEGGALGVLSPAAYECLSRLIVWGLLICLNWAALGCLSRAALALRFN